MSEAEAVRDALLRQWKLIERGVPSLDLSRPSRVAGWRNREVLAHLAVQPLLLARFLKTAELTEPDVTLVASLSGTAALAELIDKAARGASDDRLDFAANVRAARPTLDAASLDGTITTLQGSISTGDYLRTRCVEAVVHGRDFVDPISCDEEALAVAASSLISVLSARRPDLVPAAEAMAHIDWVDAATGRVSSPQHLGGALPLMR